MKNRLGVLFIAATIAYTPSLYAEIPNDFYVQSDILDIEESVAGDLANYHQRYIQWLLDQKYPIPSIILHGIGRGISINDIVYALVKQQPDRGLEIYTDAVKLLPSLPGWVCQSDAGRENRYHKEYTLDMLGPQPTVRMVANRYFKFDDQLTPYPDWKQGVPHMMASIDELIELSLNEPTKDFAAQTQKNSWWYRPYGTAVDGSKPLFVSIYSYDQQIVIDADTETLESLRASGVETVPVIFVFNGDNYIPTSDVEFTRTNNDLHVPPATAINDASVKYITNGDGDITASEVLYRYFTYTLKLTPPREWHDVDHHLMVQTNELKDLFTIPAKGSVAPETWNSIREQLQASGFTKPVMITLFGDSMERWIDDAVTVAVAGELGIERIPTVFLFHETNRYACGLPAACMEGVCDAALAAGADPSVCKKPRKSTPKRELAVPEIKEPPTELPPEEPPVPPEPPIDLPKEPKFPPPVGPASFY